MWETWVQSLDGEDPLKQEMATHSSILAWRIPWTEEPSGLQFMGSQELDASEWLNTNKQNIKWMVEVSILSWGDYPGLSRWAQCNQRVFKSVRKGQKTVSEKERWQEKQGQRSAVLQALKMEEGCQEPRNLGSLLKLQEKRGWTLF